MLINLTTDKLTFPSGGEGGRDGVTAAIMDTKRTTAVRVKPVDICKTTCEYFQCFSCGDQKRMFVTGTPSVMMATNTGILSQTVMFSEP